MDAWIRACLALGVIGLFALVSTTLVIFVVLGYSSWPDIKEVLQWWFNCFSLLLGTIVGYYFRASETVSTLPSPTRKLEAG